MLFPPRPVPEIPVDADEAVCPVEPWGLNIPGKGLGAACWVCRSVALAAGAFAGAGAGVGVAALVGVTVAGAAAEGAGFGVGVDSEAKACDADLLTPAVVFSGAGTIIKISLMTLQAGYRE